MAPVTPPRIGLAVPHTFGDGAAGGPSVDEWLAVLEAPPVASLWVLDQLAGRAPSSEAIALLGFLAARTARPRLGLAVLVGPARGPLATAKGLATIDRLSGGRLLAGIGLGGRHHYGAYGLAHGAGGPGDALDELLELLPRLWTEDVVSHAGRFWTLDDVSITPRPLQQPHPPIWIGGGSSRALRRAVTSGAGWIGAGRHSGEEFADLVLRLRGALAEAGRDPDHFPIAKRAYVLVDGRRQAARATVAQWFDQFYGDPGLGEAVTVVGDVEACGEQLAALVAAGADELVLHPLAADLDQYRAVVDDVVPLLGSTSAS